MASEKYVSVNCENGRMVITPDAEREILREAETAFMKRKTKLLQKRFEMEKGKTACLVRSGKDEAIWQ